MYRVRRLATIVALISLALVIGVGAVLAAAPGLAEGDQHNPAAKAGDGEIFTADQFFPTLTGLISTPSESVQPAGMICCGADERVRINNTHEYPWRTISYLQLYDQSASAVGHCTATFVGPDVLLTAAHCLYDTTSGWFGDIAVIPGANETYFPYGFEFAASWWVPDAWVASGGNSLYDWGVISMSDSSLGTTVGWLPIVVMSTQTLSRSDFMPAITGYPGDQVDGTMWLGSKSSFLSVEDYRLNFDIDAAHGQSGSAIFSINTNESFIGQVVGVLTDGNPNYNSGNRIDPELLYDSDWMLRDGLFHRCLI